MGACAFEALASTTAPRPDKVSVDPKELRLYVHEPRRDESRNPGLLVGPPTNRILFEALEANRQREWSLPRFENVVTWGSRAQSMIVVGQFDTVPRDGVCGATANQLAKLLLGTERGERLASQLNVLISTTGQVRYEPHDDTLEGEGVESLTRVFGIWTHCIALVQPGKNHRFLVERRPDGTVVLLQSWIGGYALTHWLTLGRVERPLDDFLRELAEAAGSGENHLTANASLFHPTGFRGLDTLDRNVRVCFSACRVVARSIAPNVAYFFTHSTFDGAVFPP